MTIEELGTAYDRLLREKQALYLTYLAHDLTIWLRSFYSDEPQLVNSHSPSGIGMINEIQHRIVGILQVVLEDEPDRPDGATFFAGLLVWAEKAHIEDIIKQALEDTFVKSTIL